MLKKLDLRGDVQLYYDLGKKIIARFPTKSNLESTGADNSLYIGMQNNIKTRKIVKTIFGFDDINQYSGHEYTFNASTGSFKVKTNINREGQVQISVGKNEMNKFYGKDPVDNYLVVIDFESKNAYKESIKNLEKAFDSYENEFLNWMYSQPERFRPKNGRPSITPKRYIYALRNVNNWFGVSIKKDLLKIDNNEDLEDVLQEVFTLPNYSEINKARSHDFSASVKAYKEFLEYMEFFDFENNNDDVVEEYSDSKFLEDVYMDAKELAILKNLLMYKKNIVLKGAPGVGKTYIAKKLAYVLMNKKNDDYICSIQFHQNYGYEDFVMGYKPKDGQFALEKGIFYNFCKKAQFDSEHNYFFIIDEINRGNLSKIFGELLMLIENDKRGSEFRVNLAYKEGDELEEFYVPKNVYIIGTMNTADRSITRMDYALRRRFSFYDISPAFDNDKFKYYISSLDNEKLKKVIDVVKEINEEIAGDNSLGKGYRIGHSYFCGLSSSDDASRKLDAIVNYELIPMLEEYWFDNTQKLDEAKRKLREIFNG